MYQYSGVVIRVIDGDSLEINVDLGFHVEYRGMKVRLAGVDAPEMSTEEGALARTWLMGQVLGKPSLLIQTEKDRTEKYGRYLVWLWWPILTAGTLTRDSSVNMAMVREGFAKPYTGGKR